MHEICRYRYQYFGYHAYSTIQDTGVHCFAKFVLVAWLGKKEQILYYCYNGFCLSQSNSTEQYVYAKA